MYREVVARSVAEVAGENARKLRLGAGLTLDLLAQAAQLYGLPWTTGRVGDFESGRAAPSLPTLYAVALALQQATGQPVTLADLFAGEGPVQINDKLFIELSELRAALSGGPVTGRVIPSGMLSATVGWAMVGVFSEADTRMCKSLGITRERGIEAMAKLWGRPFSVERDSRAEPGANAQRRGQISRQLKAELQKVINDGHH